MVNKRAKLKKTCFSDDALIAESTHSCSLVGSNDDLSTEILRRLPVDSIFRFKSVSKHWQSLLSHCRFTRLYDNVPVSPGLFLRDLYIPFDIENPAPPPFRNLNFYPDRCGIKIVQSCNGLLLCCSNRGKEDTRKYYVFNPTTKQFAVIPPVIRESGASRSIRFIGLAFHPSDFLHYKLVCFRNINRYGNKFQIQLYSSDTGKWRVSQESFTTNKFRSHSFDEVNYGVYCNRSVHWIPHWLSMVYYKLDVEQVQTMLLPERRRPSRGGMRYYFGESGGHVHLVEDARNDDPLHVNVYEMLSDYSGWFVKYRVELDELPVVYPLAYCSHDPSKYAFEIFDVLTDDEEEESAFMVVKTHEKIVRYNVVDNTFEKTIDLPNLLCCRRICYTNVHRYIQNLSSF